MAKDHICVTRLLGDIGAVEFNLDGTVTLIMFLHQKPIIHAKFLLTRKEAHVLSRVVDHLNGNK